LKYYSKRNLYYLIFPIGFIFIFLNIIKTGNIVLILISLVLTIIFSTFFILSSIFPEYSYFLTIDDLMIQNGILNKRNNYKLSQIDSLFIFNIENYKDYILFEGNNKINHFLGIGGYNDWIVLKIKENMSNQYIWISPKEKENFIFEIQNKKNINLNTVDIDYINENF